MLTRKPNDSIILAKWLNLRLRTNWLLVRIPLLSLKLQIWHFLRARASLAFRQTIEFRFTVKLVRDMIITYSQNFYIAVQEIAILMSIIKYKNKVKWIKYVPINHFLSNKSLLRQEKLAPKKKKLYKIYQWEIHKVLIWVLL